MTKYLLLTFPDDSDADYIRRDIETHYTIAGPCGRDEHEYPCEVRETDASRIDKALEAWENYEAVFEDKFPNQHAREMFEEIRRALKGLD